MKRKVFSLELLSLFMLFSFVCAYAYTAFAQTPSPTPPGVVLAPQDFFAEVLSSIQGFGGLSTLLKISAVITLIVASMKVTFLNSLIWKHLGAAQVYVAPALGLIGGLLAIGTGGAPVNAASVFAYISAGAGAVFLHEILDSIKAIPGLGSFYVAIINMVSNALGGPTPPPPPAVAASAK
jgi:hypothetical protein